MQKGSRASRLSVGFIVIFIVSQNHVPAAEPCPALSTLTEKPNWETGSGHYTAEQKGDTVTVTATGENPTAGFKVQLAREPTKSFPPRLIFYRKPPDGIAAQVITPFTVCATFKASRSLDAVTVRDNKGEHRVAVEAAR